MGEGEDRELDPELVADRRAHGRPLSGGGRNLRAYKHVPGWGRQPPMSQGALGRAPTSCSHHLRHRRATSATAGEGGRSMAPAYPSVTRRTPASATKSPTSRAARTTRQSRNPRVGGPDRALL